jgi:hypothetical protein
LQKLLIKERDKHKDALIQSNREIAAIAYARGDKETSLAAREEVLILEPNDVISLNQKGLIFSLQSKLTEAEESSIKVLKIASNKCEEIGQSAAYGNLRIVY